MTPTVTPFDFEDLPDSVRRAYPGPEGEFLLGLARQKGREGVERQKAAQVSHVS